MLIFKKTIFAMISSLPCYTNVSQSGNLTIFTYVKKSYDIVQRHECIAYISPINLLTVLFVLVT